MDPYQASKKTEEICRLAPVIPVLVVHNPDIAKPLAEALISGGLPVLEVTYGRNLPWTLYRKWRKYREA